MKVFRSPSFCFTMTASVVFVHLNYIQPLSYNESYSWPLIKPTRQSPSMTWLLPVYPSLSHLSKNTSKFSCTLATWTSFLSLPSQSTYTCWSLSLEGSFPALAGLDFLSQVSAQVLWSSLTSLPIFPFPTVTLYHNVSLLFITSFDNLCVVLTISPGSSCVLYTIGVQANLYS
jgi:hypothetical protein